MKQVFGALGQSPGIRLGPLEQQLMQELWGRGNATVRDLYEDGNLNLAYTTVMTTLDRLYKKGLLNRAVEGRAFRYAPRQTQEELQREAAVEGIRQLLSSGASSSLPLSYLVEALSDQDAQLLDQLQELVERKRRELHNTEK